MKMLANKRKRKSGSSTEGRRFMKSGLINLEKSNMKVKPCVVQ